MIRFPAGRSSTSTPGSPPSSSGLDEPQPALAAGEQRRRDLVEVLRDRGERLCEAALDRRRRARRGASRAPRGSARDLRAASSGRRDAPSRRRTPRARAGLTCPSVRAARLEPLDARRELVAIVALGRLDGACRLEAARRLGDVGVDPRDLDLGGRHRRARLLELAPKGHLGRAETSQLLAELAGTRRACVDARAKRSLEARRRALRGGDPLAEARAARSTRRRSVAASIVAARTPRRSPERGLGRRGALGASPRARSLRPRPLPSSADRLGRERGAPALELEQDGLGGLADEPELAACRVVAESLRRDGRHCVASSSSSSGTTGSSSTSACGVGPARTVRLPRPAARARWSSASPTAGSSASTADARERSAAATARSAPGATSSVGKREPRAVLGERPRGRRETLLLGERLIERAHALADERGALGRAPSARARLPAQPPPRARRRARAERASLCSLRTRLCAASRRGTARRARSRTRREARGARCHPAAGSAPQPRPRAGRLRRRARPRRGRGRRASPSSRPCAPALREEPPRRAVPRPLPDARPTSARSSCAIRARSACDLDAELLGALRRRGLERERPQALAHLLLDVASALDLHGDARELQLGAMPAPLELPEAGGLLDERAPVLRPSKRAPARPSPGRRSSASPSRGRRPRGSRRDRYGVPPRGSRGTGPRRRGRAVARSRPRRSRGRATCRPRCRRRARPRSARAAFRSPPPAKRTSSGFSARSSDGVSEPAAQTIASAMFDLPEPFGPTMTATPGSSEISSVSGNDLKPRMRSERRCTEAAFSRTGRTEMPLRPGATAPASRGLRATGDSALADRRSCAAQMRSGTTPSASSACTCSFLLGRFLRRAPPDCRAAPRRRARRTRTCDRAAGPRPRAPCSGRACPDRASASWSSVL